MHCLTRIGLAALGLALAAPTVGWADGPTPPPGPTHKHRRNLFGKEILCSDCQRARIKAKDGVDIPPPPPLPPPGSVVMEGRCTSCEQAGAGAGAGAIAPGPVLEALAPGPVLAQSNEGTGHAVVGGEAPGHAVVVAEPQPIGLAQSRTAAASARRTAARSSKATSDPGVMASSFNPVAPPSGRRPHIIEHLFGLDSIGRHSREEFERRAREKHASISYNQKEEKVTELPSSLVYGKH